MSAPTDNSKLPLEAADQLKVVPVSEFQAGRLLLGPVYLLFQKNQKFIQIKGTFDFFSDSDLIKLRAIQSLYVPIASNPLEQKREQGVQIRAYLNSIEQTREDATAEGFAAFPTPSPGEVSKTVFKMLPGGWGQAGVLSHADACAWADGCCESVPTRALDEAKARGTAFFAQALRTASWSVLLALHQGCGDPRFLDELRLYAFEGRSQGLGEGDDLLQVAARWVREYPESISLEHIARDEATRITQKIAARLRAGRRLFDREVKFG